MYRFFVPALCALSAALVVACGGGGGGTPATTISGSAVKGPVSGATVMAKDVNGNVLGTTTTGAGGTYSLSVNYSGDVVIEVSGGSYTDEATGASTPLSSPLKVVLAAGGGTVTGMVTPLTTMAFNSATIGSAKPSSANFKQVASALATQFKLAGVDLATTLPAVTGTTNDYGKVLAALSKYLQQNSKTLATLVGTALSNTDWTAFSTPFSAAYTAANGTVVSYAFDGSAFAIAGTGAGGGSGTCGVSATGTAAGLPINLNYCVTGIAAGSCSAGNASLNSALSGASTPGVSLTYTYSSACAAGATTIALN